MGSLLPNQALTDKVKSMIPRLKGRVPGPKKSGRGLFFHGLLLLLGSTAGLGFSLVGNTGHLVNGFLRKEITEFKFNVFLTDHADRSFLEEHFLSTPGVRSIRFVTREEALGRAHDDPALVQSLKLIVRNPLPESFEVVWDPAFLTPALIVPMVEKWKELDGVAQVAFDQSRLERAALLGRVNDEIALFSSVFLWGALVVAILGVGGILFNRSVPLPLGPSLSGLVVGTCGGGLGVAAVFGWMGVWESGGVLAGALAGLLGGGLRGYEKG